MVLFAFVVLCAASACSNSSTDRDNAQITDSIGILIPDTTFHDLGELEYGDVVCLKNKLTNQSNRVIKITDIETDCGCLSVSEVTEPVQPGESTRLSMEYDTHGSIGKQYHLVTLKTNQGQTIKICVYADVLE